jgi:uncharacterized protein (TIGR00369 family)
MNDQHGFEDASPRIQERIRASFARQGLMSHLGASLSRIGSGRVHIVLPHRPEITQQDGYIHAGATSAIADSAGGYAALTCFPDHTSVLTVEYKINLIAPVGPMLRPRCKTAVNGGSALLTFVRRGASRRDLSSSSCA